MAGEETDADGDAGNEGAAGPNGETSAATGGRNDDRRGVVSEDTVDRGTVAGGTDREDVGRERVGREGIGSEDSEEGDRERDRPPLAEYVRDAAARGESKKRLVERVRASYDREIPYRRVRRLVEAERERLDRQDTGLVVEKHPPRYVAIDDLAALTDAEFGRVVAHLLGGREGRAEAVAAAERADQSEDGTEIRWHRNGETTVVRAVAAEPGHVIDGALVRRVCEQGRQPNGKNETDALDDGTETGTELGVGSGDENDGDGEEGDGMRGGRDDGGEEHASVDAALVTVADVVPGATRLAVRSGVAIYDRADVRRWLDEARLATGTFGSLIENA